MIVDPGFGNWLAGFIDGEGCFVIKGGGNARTGKWKCHFAIWLRADDREILVEIQRQTGIGRLLERPGRKGQLNPQVIWQVQSRADCLRLVEILDVHPLRAKKRHDYALWREAALTWTLIRRGSGAIVGINAPHWDEMARLAQCMSAGRRYAEVQACTLSAPQQLH